MIHDQNFIVEKNTNVVKDQKKYTKTERTMESRQVLTNLVGIKFNIY
jgi:hypothetical protein